MFELVQIAVKWRKPILIVCLLAIIISVVVSLMLPNYYESVSLFFPSNPGLTDRQNLFREKAADVPVSFFGKEQDADRLLQIAKSAQLAGYIINKFDLYKHYDISKETSKFPEWEVNKEFKDNYDAFKNEYGAIEIHMMDQSNTLAADIVNEVVAQINKINSNMITENKTQIVAVFKERVAQKEKEVQMLTDSILKLKAMGNNTMMKSKINNLLNVKENAVKDMNSLSTIYDQNKAAANASFSSIYLLESAYPSEKKVKPIRWLIVVGSFLGALFLSLTVVVAIEKAKELKLDGRNS